ncbi:hypothetical protein N2152v2_002848 [Parachlorella kessleri]
MLRSGLSRRGLQKLCLLEGRHEARLLEPGLHAQLQQARPFADTSSDGNGNSSVKYARERAAFESSLSELRKQWAQQRLARLERRAAKEEEKRLQREAAKAQRAQQDAAAKQAKLQLLLERQAAEREIHVWELCARMPADIAATPAASRLGDAATVVFFVLQAQAKVERLKRHFLRQEVLEVALEERRLRLLEESKNWITADTLDMRIKEALENPVPLFPSAEQQQQQQQPQAAASGASAVV